tara:strand:+ start:1235 stop:1354 length:120 start_codon:yes stop_codon:yes gene_type:complete
VALQDHIAERFAEMEIVGESALHQEEFVEMFLLEFLILV